MSVAQSVEAAAFPSFQLVEEGKTSLTPDEFVDELRTQLDDTSLIRFVKNNKDVVISDELKSEIILGKHTQYDLSDRTVQILIKKLNPKIILDTFSGLISKYGASLSLLKHLHKQGVPSQWFNTPNLNGRTMLQTIAWKGDTALFKEIAKDIPKDQILLENDLFFKEEMQDCLVEGGEVDLSRFDLSKTMVAQNGCRAVIMTDEGEIHSYPGQDASKLAQQMANGEGMDSLTIYQNTRHASIAFSDAHFGFYPISDDKVEEFQDRIVRLGAVALGAQSSTMSGASLGMQSGSSSLIDSSKSKKAVGVPHQALLSKNLPDQCLPYPCAVTEDSWQKTVSEMTNGLVLTVYAPKDKVAAVRQYAMKIQDACKAGDAAAAYHALTNNCIDFVRQAVQASGTKADFRDAFHTMQYFRRPGMANFYSVFRSNQPIIHTNSSLFGAASIAAAVDRLSRNTLFGGLLSISGVLYAYSAYKGIPKAIAASSRAGSRVQWAVLSMAGWAAAIGTIFLPRL